MKMDQQTARQNCELCNASVTIENYAGHVDWCRDYRAGEAKRIEARRASAQEYCKPNGAPVIFANRTQANNKARQLGAGWHTVQSPLSRRFYVKKFNE